MEFTIEKSNLQNKKYKVVIYKDNKKVKTIQFGAKGYEDYTQHKNLQRKENYLNRHYQNEYWGDILTAGCWSRFILWNKKTIQESIKDIEKRFNIKCIGNYI